MTATDDRAAWLRDIELEARWVGRMRVSRWPRAVPRDFEPAAAIAHPPLAVPRLIREATCR